MSDDGRGAMTTELTCIYTQYRIYNTLFFHLKVNLYMFICILYGSLPKLLLVIYILFTCKWGEYYKHLEKLVNPVKQKRIYS